ncbi:ABC transporter substrate-binding protein [Algoriphagus hitonicola]|uniref:ABC-type Fe3+-hydroxamate transport system, substrate-binding protein n=1 Tax=Algoriphagus hitonicola TaxID=435880 RepID=A0A1I2XUC3_9BACT|nr:helical backbone metal receptor [Algoriphagus hitonicola]SFH17074.1 ABC-type Fe3+-hydroxamate transport system, substrate-binding protein [Algoriphagus hitonicola]
MEFIDQLGRRIFLENFPQRIISLVPSQTELLVDVGLDDRLVGVTKFCVHPSRLKKSKTIIGGTKNLRLQEIHNLQPDLIIGNKEENEKDLISRLEEHFSVWISDVSNLEEAKTMISGLGQITGTEKKATEIIHSIENNFNRPLNRKGRAIYLIWKNPIIVAGQGTFISAIMDWAGFENRVEEKRYPSFSENELINLEPEYLLLSSEPYPFKESDVAYFQKILPNTHVLLVDGEYFSWYGSRLVKAGDYFHKLSDLQ